MKASPIDRIMRLEHRIRLCDFKDYPQEVKCYLEAKINIWLNQDLSDKEKKRLRVLKNTLDELQEKSREKRLRKIAESEQHLAEYGKVLEDNVRLYKQVEDKAKEKLIDMARAMVDKAGGKGCFDNMVELREKRLKGESVQEGNRRKYKELDPNVTERLVWATDILHELEDKPF